jgi:hypothetical protein
MENTATLSAGTYYPCGQCSQPCGDRYWHVKRVRARFCSQDCAKQFMATHEVPKPPKPKCWTCNKEMTTGFRLRDIRGSKFCSRECLSKYEAEENQLMRQLQGESSKVK